MATKGLVIAAAAFAVASGVAIGASLPGAGGTIDISVDDPRPVAKAVQTLVERYGYQITYEDPRYAYRDDLVDRYVNGFKDHIPAGGVLSFSFHPSAATPGSTDIAAALASLLQAHAVGESGGRFIVLNDKDAFHVVPRETRDINGNWIQQSSVLDAPITLSRQERSGFQAVDAICDAVRSATGVNIVVGGTPTNAMVQTHGELEATHEPARTVLLRALNRARSKLTWMLLYDPDGKSYFLNIVVVPPPQP